MSAPQPPQTPDPRYSSGSFPPSNSLGRDVRLFIGAAALIADFVLYYLEHVRATPPIPLGTHDTIMHLAWAVCALFLMDPKRALELVASIKDKIPGLGGK